MLKVLQNKLNGRALLALLFFVNVSTHLHAQPEPLNPQLTQEEIEQYPVDSAQAWLTKMSQASRSLNFSITFVLLKPGVDSQPYLWRHGVTAEGIEMEELNLLNGAGKKALRVDKKVSYFEPNVPPYSLVSTTINGPFPSQFFRYPEKLFVGYDLVMVGKSRVSGRAAQQIRIISKDKSRYGLNVWLDQETGLLLKMNMFNLKNQLLEQIQVTGLQVTEQPDPFFSKIEIGMLPEVVNIEQNKKIRSPWQIGYLPVGMELVNRKLRRLSITSEVVEYVMLSDGLVDISLYIQENVKSKTTGRLVGANQTDTLFTIQNGPLNITIIGKIPAATANAIATSIQRQP
ncbi:MucB/RseB C-terminal domain-containing protein [Paraglaciecola aquimarina]|uniref:MucB/RseB C-terminal domain-containing protein n=1 Tax=Paraglaciecola algarum TaxID=3050085 RepID=A0ABS9D229_9ALTE|nr:MucB/RseB C-terminal domain-containing protein [Paraglaciecola sp. G1-23]MCF2946547.1 MucB/RseB C-terminal domain-containing protein [Paraglaciecola sp. G1-23]